MHTDDEDKAGFASLAGEAEEAERLRQLQRRQACTHEVVTIATRPWCSLCGQPLELTHPMAQAALEALRRMGKATP